MKQFLKIAVVICVTPWQAALAQAGTTCPLVLSGNFPVTYADGRIPVITVKIGGKTFNMLVDSGSGISAITVSSWNALGGPPFRQIDGSYGTGVGGDVQFNTGLLEDVDTGHAIAKDQAFIVSDQAVPAIRGKKMADGVLGYDFLDNFDIGFDLPDNCMSLYFIQHCGTAQAPWTGDYDVEALSIHAQGLDATIPYTIDGQTLQGLIDSGAYSTLVSEAALDRTGIKPAAIMNLSKTGTGLGGRPFTYRIEKFGSAAIGAEQFGNVWLRVGKIPVDGFTDILVGEDY